MGGGGGGGCQHMLCTLDQFNTRANILRKNEISY